MSQSNEGVRKFRDVWRVGFRPRDSNNKFILRKTLPFDNSTEEEAKRVYMYFSQNRGGKFGNETFGIPGDQIQSIDAIIATLKTGTLDKVLNSFKKKKKKKKKKNNAAENTGSTKEEISLRGVSYDANNMLVVRLRLPYVLKKLRVYKVPFHYVLARKAGLAYDYAVTYFCKLLTQKCSHLLNFPSETLCYSQQLELRVLLKKSF
jgi:hypothetical protein